MYIAAVLSSDSYTQITMSVSCCMGGDNVCVAEGMDAGWSLCGAEDVHISYSGSALISETVHTEIVS